MFYDVTKMTWNWTGHRGASLFLAMAETAGESHALNQFLQKPRGEGWHVAFGSSVLSKVHDARG
jgi:hypothetical protein